METWQVPIIFAAGVITGIINTLAGGGSLLTLPILIFIGLPSAAANGTNRLAIMVQNICAVAGFKKKGVSNFRLSLVETNSTKAFVIGVYTLFALLVFAFNGKICWAVAMALATGNGLGGWIGSHWAVAIGERWIRIVLILCVMAMVIKLFGLIP